MTQYFRITLDKNYILKGTELFIRQNIHFYHSLIYLFIYFCFLIRLLMCNSIIFLRWGCPKSEMWVMRLHGPTGTLAPPHVPCAETKFSCTKFDYSLVLAQLSFAFKVICNQLRYVIQLPKSKVLCNCRQYIHFFYFYFMRCILLALCTYVYIF